MKNGKDSTHKKRAFRKRLKKSRHKKEHVGFLWNPMGKKRSFKASADGHSAPRRQRGRHRRLCGAKCLTPAPRRQRGRHRRLCGAKCLTPAPRRQRGRHRRLCGAKCLTSDFITSKHKKRTQRVLMESAVGIYFRRGKRASFKASAAGHSAPRRQRGRHRRLCEAKCLTPVPRRLRGRRRRLCGAKCLTSSFYFYPFIKT